LTILFVAGAFVFLVALLSWGGWLGLIAFIILVGVLMVTVAGILEWLRPECPGCQSKSGYRYLHSTKKGERDHRFKVNPYRCVACGREASVLDHR